MRVRPCSRLAREASRPAPTATPLTPRRSQAVTSTGASSTNSFQFTGREYDGAGLSFYRARYYSPTVGRFISEDPLGFPGSPLADLYAYVGNNPVSLLDPLGLVPGCGFVCSVLHLSATDWASILGFVSVLASGVAIVAALAEFPVLLTIAGLISIGTSAASTGLTCTTNWLSSSCVAGMVGTAINLATFGIGSAAKAPLVRALAGAFGYLASLVTLSHQERWSALAEPVQLSDLESAIRFRS